MFCQVKNYPLKFMAKHEAGIVVISDVHLGTFGCQAKELLKYLKSIRPKILILNRGIIDIWQFSKSYRKCCNIEAL